MDAFHDLDGIDVARAVLRDVLRGLDLEREDHRRVLRHLVAAMQQLAFSVDPRLPTRSDETAHRT